MAMSTKRQLSARRERIRTRLTARKNERMRRRRAIREGLALWHETLQQERARRPGMVQAAAAGIPITFAARGGPQLVFRFGKEVRTPDGITVRPSTSAVLVMPEGNVRRLLPRETEDA
jgi:hypothetical protein